MTPEEIINVLRQVDADAKASEGDYYADQFAWHGAGEIADAVEQMAAEIARLREERRWVPVGGEIVDMEFSSELGVYYGTIRCPKCNWEGEVSPMADRPKCRCGVEWGFSVSAAGLQPLPPGPEAGVME